MDSQETVSISPDMYGEFIFPYYKKVAERYGLLSYGCCEPVDPVRIYTNRSSGKMGYSLAKECSLRGADVTLVTGKTALEPWPFVKVVPIETAQQMFEEVTSRAPEMDIIIKAAAVADYRPKSRCRREDQKE